MRTFCILDQFAQNLSVIDTWVEANRKQPLLVADTLNALLQIEER
jgi:hypothetical protein